eukprot:10532930-Lingulodinium_polyedra.AAC.1
MKQCTTRCRPSQRARSSGGMLRPLSGSSSSGGGGGSAVRPSCNAAMASCAYSRRPRCSLELMWAPLESCLEHSRHHGQWFLPSVRT